MYKSVIRVGCFLLLSATLYAQDIRQTKNGVRAQVKDVNIKVVYYSPGVVRIIKSPGTINTEAKSLVVTQSAGQVKFTVKRQNDLLTIASSSVETRVDLKTGQVSFSRQQQALFTEKQRPVFEPFDDAGSKTYHVYQPFQLDKDEQIYGLGQLQQGKMVQRNLEKYLIQGNTEDVMPFFQSVKGYGIYWDNYSPTTFKDSQDETSFRSEVGDKVDYYFMYGGNADGVIAQMRWLTGKAPMYPLWTFGFWQSKERYKSQDEAVGVVKKYRELGVPIDGIIQDWQYWGTNFQWNAMEFNNPLFPAPKKMVDDVHALNAHMIISIWASFGPQTKIYETLDKKGMLFNFKTWPLGGADKWPPDPKDPSGVRVYDAYNPEARNIYWDYLNKGVFSTGMDGWWMDSTEPDHLEGKPEDMDTKTYLGSFRKVRNAYPLMTVGGVADHQRATSADKRVFILTRSVFAGQQRYGSTIWSGDIVSSWDVFRKQISAGLNLSLCGVPYWNTDIGGFFLWNYPNKLEDADYRELYVRWLQFGTFCSMMRSHGADAPREIYQFGQKGGKYYNAIEKYINLRYRLLPYIYSTSWQVTANNSSMMRALVMDFPKDKKALDLNNEYMFGKALLVNPVTEAMYSKLSINGKDTTHVEDFGPVKSQQVYLPKGSAWYDFWTDEKHQGGQTISKATPLDVMPLFVKSGSIIPLGPEVKYATEKKWDDLEIRVYRGADGTFTLYEDENDNYNYEKGISTQIGFVWNDKKGTLLINNRKGTFPGMLNSRKFRITLIGSTSVASAATQKTVTYTGKQLAVQF